MRNRSDETATLLEELRLLEHDASAACREAVERVPDEPLTRGQLLAFMYEHDAQRAALAGLLSKLPRPRGARPSRLRANFEGRTGSIAVLRVIRHQAELGVLRYRDALSRAPAELEPKIRAHTNAWLRHRAWLTARIDAFARERDSQRAL